MLNLIRFFFVCFLHTSIRFSRTYTRSSIVVWFCLSSNVHKFKKLFSFARALNKINCLVKETRLLGKLKHVTSQVFYQPHVKVPEMLFLSFLSYRILPTNNAAPRILNFTCLHSLIFYVSRFRSVWEHFFSTLFQGKLIVNQLPFFLQIRD